MAARLELYNNDSWEVDDNAVSVGFYNANEDSNNKAPEWYIEAGNVETFLAPGELVHNYDASNTSFWNTPASPSEKERLYRIVFPGPAEHKRFVSQAQRHELENQLGCEATDKAVASAFGTDGYGANMYVDPMEVEEVDEESWQDADETLPVTADVADDDEAIDMEEDKNVTGMVMGAGERSFLIRGDRLAPLHNTEFGLSDTGTSHRMAALAAGDGTYVTPSCMVLGEHERKLNLLTPAKPSALLHTDLETGAVVSEYAFTKNGVDTPILEITNDAKGGQLTGATTLMSVHTNRIGRWDTRTREGLVSEMGSPAVAHVAGKDYARGTNFTCIKTSGTTASGMSDAGFVVVGSDDGKIRLYNNKTDKSLNRASTSIPGMGMPITSVDVTHDGGYVIATTDKYLMLIKTDYVDKDGKATNAFASRAGKSAPTPRLLKLRPEDMALVGGRKAAFKHGKFSFITTSGVRERHICASVGDHYTVLWNLNGLRQSTAAAACAGMHTVMDQYVLIRKDEEIVTHDFMHQSETTPEKPRETVAVATKTNLWVTPFDG